MGFEPMAEAASESPEQRPVESRLFTDPDAYTLANGLSDARIAGAMPGGFRARIATLHLGEAYAIVGRANAALTMRGDIGPWRAFTFGLREGAPRHLCGTAVAFGQLYQPRPREAFHGHSPSGEPWPFGTVVTTFETFARLAPAYAGRNVVPPADDAALVSAPPAARDRLIALMHDAAGLADLQPEIARQDAPARSLAGSLLDALFACIAQGRTEPDRAAIRRHRQTVARLERLMEERPEQPWSVAELCAAIGVAERTLNLACHEFYGAGPLRVVRDRRLDAVRQALRGADATATTVAAAAMRFGFWELGRFAGAYRARFGETPSATLRRPAG
jgi:AraC-like DNA-binding protein